MTNGEDKQEPEDDERIGSPHAIVVVSKSITALVPHAIMGRQNVDRRHGHNREIIFMADS